MNNKIWVLISFLVGLVLFSGNCFADSECFEENGLLYCNDVTSYTDTNGKVFSGIGTITISSGDKSITILDRNLGATTNDISKTGSYGYYFQWGNNYGFPSVGDIKTSKTNADTSNNSRFNPYNSDIYILNSKFWEKNPQESLWGEPKDGEYKKQGPCPVGYHIPTSGERNLIYKFIEPNLKGLGNLEKTNKFANILKLPLAGYRGRENGNIGSQKKYGNYWSSSISSDTTYSLVFGNGTITQSSATNGKRPSGFSVRCFKDIEKNEFALNFNTMGGTAIQSQTVPSNGSGHVLGYEPTRTGFIFEGWYSDSDFKTLAFDGYFTTFTLIGDTTIYAKWIDENEEENESEDINIETEQSGNCVRLPEGYQEVEYIESHGQEYIDTNLLFNKDKDSRLSIVISNIQSLEKTAIFGAQSGNSRSFIYFNKQLYLGNGESRNDIILNNDKHILSAKWLSNSGILQGFLDDELNFSKPQYGEFASDISLYLLYVHNGNGAIPIGLRLYGFKAYISDDLVFDGVPCITSGDEYGLYDLVSKKFFGNSGEGAFSGGNIVQTDLCESDNPIEDSKGTYTVKFIYVDEEPIKLLSGDIVGEKTFNKGEIIQFPDENSIAPYPTSGYVFSGWIEKENRVKKAPAKMAKGGSQEPLETNLQSSKVLTTQNDNSNDDIIVSSNMTFIAQFKEAESTIGSGENENVNSGENQIINTGSRRKKKSNKTTENNETEQKNSNIVYNESFSEELNDAYKFAYENNITTMDSIEKADMYGKMDRISMAKMLSQFAINVLGKTPADIEVPNFTDISEELDEQYLSGVTLAYKLGIMGINMPNNEFRPFDLVPRAEFGTALSRMLYKLADGNDIYYSTHLNKLKSEGILKDINPSLLELRGWGMLMLMRSSSK